MTKWPVALILVIGLAAQGCNDGDEPPIGKVDAKPFPDGTDPFLSPCEKDSDCGSGHCVTMGTSKLCSRPCSSTAPCPSLVGWTCNSQSFCECDYKGKQEQTCNVDGDCDGSPDKIPTNESCNGEDDDCSGEADDNILPGAQGSTKYFQDNDGDSYGDDNATQWFCTKPATGWTDKGEDCDDSRKEDNPGAEEICGDNYDNDCDGNKEDSDLCGLIPPVVPDVNGSDKSGILKTCATGASTDKRIDITEIVAKQDKSAIKFTVRLAGKPAVSLKEGCSSYILKFSNYKQTMDLLYIYRPNTSDCKKLPVLEAYLKGQPISTTVVTGFLANEPGHVSWIFDKTELFANLTTPTYQLQACANLVADATQDLTTCDDFCEVPVHR